VIKEQSRLDVYVMIEAYLNILIERLNLIAQERYMSKITFLFIVE
jgi:hypothetical protein